MSYPDRIDFKQQNDGSTIVVKLRHDKGAMRDIPTSHERKNGDFDLDAALAWCRENGYTVLTWPGGARAWRGPKPRVIRTRRQIARFRAQLERELEYLRNTKSQDAHRRAQLMRLVQFDLAYYG